MIHVVGVGTWRDNNACCWGLDSPTLLNCTLLLVLRQCLSHIIHRGRLPRNLRVARSKMKCTRRAMQKSARLRLPVMLRVFRRTRRSSSSCISYSAYLGGMLRMFVCVLWYVVASTDCVCTASSPRAPPLLPHHKCVLDKVLEECLFAFESILIVGALLSNGTQLLFGKVTLELECFKLRHHGLHQVADGVCHGVVALLGLAR